MMREAIAALKAALPDGISHDGLEVQPVPDGYEWSTPEETVTVEPEAITTRAEHDRVYVTNWYYWTRLVDIPVPGHRYRFLRWLERSDRLPVRDRVAQLADGVTRDWGEVAITAAVDHNGQRKYEIRHRDDREQQPDTLEPIDDVLELDDLARLDDHGRYRPLRTAPSLRSGWYLTTDSGRALMAAIETLYPATISNWSLEQQAALDVCHWTTTAARQSGMYAVVDDLPIEVLSRGVQACCTDETCLKRRRWEYDEDTPIQVPSGDQPMPCREPCSLFIAAAREWTKEADAPPGPETGELASIHHEQIKAVLDAVAEHGISEIRDGAVEHPANRYRVRYLRALLSEIAHAEDSDQSRE